MSKLICMDLDETLLTSDKTISPRTLDALNRAVAAGNYIALTSGRSIPGCELVSKSYGLDGKNCYILGFQGGILFEQETKKVIFRHSLAEDFAIRLMNQLFEEGYYAQTYDDSHILSPYDCEALAHYNSITKEEVRFFSSTEELRGTPHPKIIVIDYENHDRLEDFRLRHLEEFQDFFEVTFSSPCYLEYTPKGVHKGAGMQELASYLGLSMEDTIAIGDERNDITMISMAGIGVAMANARTEAKEVASYITEADHDHDGVLEVIEKFVL